MKDLPLNQILCGDCVKVLKDFPDNSIDLVVTDPPYGLNFMGKDWDKALPSREAFTEIIRVLKPGALAFVMSSPRQDLLWRMLSMLEGVGFELTQSYIDWIYKTGFPKAFDISKALDRKLGKFKERRIIGKKNVGAMPQLSPRSSKGVIKKEGIDEYYNEEALNITEPATELAKIWDGWKSQTGLKPAHEPILMVNKPFSESTIVDNVLKWGTGAINVDSCRIPFNQGDIGERPPRSPTGHVGGWKDWSKSGFMESTKGRFPANLLVSDKALDTGELTTASHRGVSRKGKEPYPDEDGWIKRRVFDSEIMGYPDSGGASRYFDLDAWSEQHGLDFDYSINYDKQLASLWYKFIEDHKGDVDDSYLFDCLKETLKILRPDLYDLSCLLYDVPKPNKKERNMGLSGMPKGAPPRSKRSKPAEGRKNPLGEPRANYHPTVKPVKLMAYLIELGCPPDGVVLDPFVGSGTTCIAAKKLVRKYVGIEINPEYVALAQARIRAYPIPFDWFTNKGDIG